MVAATIDNCSDAAPRHVAELFWGRGGGSLTWSCSISERWRRSKISALGLAISAGKNLPTVRAVEREKQPHFGGLAVCCDLQCRPSYLRGCAHHVI
jgi:hypothetical protein